MEERAWWKERVVYQIWPRSFKDGNGDGVGDLRGVIEKLDYLQWLGVGIVWLNPCYDSPNDDMGYDIRDYEKIMREFGTMADMDELIRELHRRDIKLIMDLVVNHTSDEHRWFVESRKSKDNPYRDYYIWRPGKDGKEPNNWGSFFTPSAWTYDEATEEWYLHLFSVKQPDLNWENPKVHEEIFGMMNRWFERGIDGFRMDVINLIAKEPGLPDGSGKADREGYVFCPEHFACQPALHTYLKEMRRRCFDGKDLTCVGETPFVTDETGNALINPANHELDMIFRLDMMSIDTGPGGKWDIVPWTVQQFKQLLHQLILDEGWNTLLWGNHDQPRMISRFGCVETEELRVRSAKMLAALMYLRRGTPFLFMGEEIGMTNVPFHGLEDLRDVESINAMKLAEKYGTTKSLWESILQKGRDHARTPLQWDDSRNAGFSSAEPWIMVNPNYAFINVKASLLDPDSILHFYQKLLALRAANPALIYGGMEDILPEDEQIVAYTREMDGERWLVLCNMSKTPAPVPDLPAFADGQLMLTNLNAASEKTLRPYEVRVIRNAV